jgi:hypothetical protein
MIIKNDLSEEPEVIFMGRNVISAKLDIIFKKIFTENDDMLHEFVAAMLGIPSESIEYIQITNPEMPPDIYSGKFARLDLNMKVDNRLVNVEIQVKNDPDYRDRTLFYWAKLYTSELKSGDDYGELKQSITINIINFNMFDGNDYHTEIVTSNKATGEIFSDKFAIHFFELKKISRTPNPGNPKELWLQYINADTEEELNMLEQTNLPIMKKAVRVVRDMSDDTRIREAARIREKALHDEASALKNARMEGMEEGMAQGMAQGRAEERNNIINKLRLAGFSDEQINGILGS